MLSKSIPSEILNKHILIHIKQHISNITNLFFLKKTHAETTHNQESIVEK